MSLSCQVINHSGSLFGEDNKIFLTFYFHNHFHIASQQQPTALTTPWEAGYFTRGEPGTTKSLLDTYVMCTIGGNQTIIYES